MVKRRERKAKTKGKDDNSTFIVNSLLFLMKHRFKSTVLDPTLQPMLQYYDEKIADAKVLLHNTVVPGKMLIKT